MERMSLKAWLRQHYHWVVFAVVFLEFTVTIGLGNNLYGLYLIPITEGLGISRSAFAIAPSIKYLAAFFSNLIFGILYRRYGYRRMATLALILVCLSYVGYGTAQNVIPFCIGAMVIGLIEPFYATAATSRIIGDWFHRHQGTILGVVLAASGLGGSLFSGILSGLIQNRSWRFALLFSACLFVLSAVAVFFFVPDKPEKMGLCPYGDESDRAEERKKHAKNVQEWDGFPLGYLRSRPSFYLMLIATFLISFITYGMYTVIPAHVQDQGMSQSTAALTQSVMFMTLAGAKVLEGVFSDRFGAKRVMILCLILNVASMLLLAWIRTPWMAILGVTVFSLPFGIPSIMLPVLTAETFGRHDYGTILGLMLAMVSLSGVVAGPVINFSYDLLGSYTPAFLVMAVLGVVTMAVYLAAFRAAEQDRKKAEL